ncbi:hypothetical protein [Paenibacillus periandrae]|uniref:hypothetical protein n=1 Tax=Paenibacillus periandrae TaxID=1761741 RepID=UPI001F096AF8|nr:hypothetical protein [Paenibacillus periandrae]
MNTSLTTIFFADSGAQAEASLGMLSKLLPCNKCTGVTTSGREVTAGQRIEKKADERGINSYSCGYDASKVENGVPYSFL